MKDIWFWIWLEDLFGLVEEKIIQYIAPTRLSEVKQALGLERFHYLGSGRLQQK